MLAREDMLELTRRMTPTRSSFDRIAGAYMDSEGFVDGSFNVHFLKLKLEEKTQKLALAKQIPYSKTGVQLREFHYPKESQKSGTVWQLLNALLDCGLKNDALLQDFYEIVGEHYKSDHDYAVLFYHDRYDIPAKGSDKKWQWESDEMFEYLICAICPLYEDYKLGAPECGFMYPAYENHAASLNHLAVYQENPSSPHRELTAKILRCKEYRLMEEDDW